ncbi:MAG: hypothetical protein MUC31_00165 [Bacteroidales bacterium]|jgi:hypothetical protein|nr:hypothetical protein [Bacteroidales bacterium]
MSNVYFKEEQKFRQPWIWMIVVLLSGLWIWQLVQQIFMGIPFGDNPAPDLFIILMGLFPLAAFLLFRFLTLETLIDHEGVHYRFKPFQRKFRNIIPGEISRFEVKKYSPIKDYGGWGVRYGSAKNGRAYNVSGNKGVLFELKNGKRFMLGTQNPESIRSAMDKLMKFTSI